MVLEEANEEEWKVIAASTLFAGLAYVFTDVALSGVVNLLSVAAYVAVFIVILVAGQFLIGEN